jgi:hypothetical protein
MEENREIEKAGNRETVAEKQSENREIEKSGKGKEA